VIAYASGVEPSTTLSSASICEMIRRLSEMWISGFMRKRMFALACDLSVQMPGLPCGSRPPHRVTLFTFVGSDV
jgi:hypothetical protein